MNVYDFDGTIYAGDSTVDFYLFCVKRRPRVLRALPRQVTGTVKYAIGKLEKTQWKEQFFSFLLYVPDVESMLEKFCLTNRKKIKAWYRTQKREDDVIISASPRFLVERFCCAEGIANVIATEVDVYSGKILGKNCRGGEKVNRFCEQFNVKEIDRFYSDSKSDAPLAEAARESYFVRKYTIEPWR